MAQVLYQMDLAKNVGELLLPCDWLERKDHLESSVRCHANNSARNQTESLISKYWRSNYLIRICGRSRRGSSLLHCSMASCWVEAKCACAVSLSHGVLCWNNWHQISGGMELAHSSGSTPQLALSGIVCSLFPDAVILFPQDLQNLCMLSSIIYC